MMARSAPSLTGQATLPTTHGDYSGEGWVEWLAGDDGLEGGEQRHALFSKGGKVPAQGRERFGAVV